MKARPKFLIVLLAIFTITQAQAMRWYSPSTGSWFSRDPIEEIGFSFVSSEERPNRPTGNLYGFVENDPVYRYDRLGLDWRGDTCCRCGKTYKRGLVGTGVFKCWRPSRRLGHSYPHAWIEVPSSSYSVGFYPGSTNPFGGLGSLESPDGASDEAKDAGKTSKWCDEIKMDACSYDLELFKKIAMSWKSKTPSSWYFFGLHDCGSFVDFAIMKATYESAYPGRGEGCEHEKLRATWD